MRQARRPRSGRTIAALFFASLLAAAPGAAEEKLPSLTASGQGDIPAKFEPVTDAFDHVRREVVIPMRDGVKLRTIIYIPKNAPEPLPIILSRTPYNAASTTGAVDAGSPRMAMVLGKDWEPVVRSGYIVALQDVRGIHGSEGAYILNLPLRGALNRGRVDHATDTWDTIDWLVKNVPGNNGKVGLTGSSYGGFLTLMGLFDPHPALAAAVPAHPMVDTWMGDDWYHNGALRQMMVEWAYGQMTTKKAERSLPFGHYDIYAAFLEAGSAGEFSRRHGADRLPAWRRILDNPAYTSYWQEQALQRHLERIDLEVPTLTVHGLFDQEDMFGPLASYAVLEKKDARNDLNFLVIGPWHHSQFRRDGFGVGKIQWGTDTSRWYRETVRQAFWDQHLKGIRPAKPLPPVLAYDTGANAWREYDAWPPKSATRSLRLYLHPGGRLGLEAPRAGDGYTEYVSDPAKPVPFRVRPIQRMYAQDSGWRTWLTEDQRPFADRPDVLTFVSAPLTEPITVSGEVAATLFAATTGTDADWVVKLIDVYPDEYPAQPELGGYQLMISADILRGRYRESFEQARPIPAGAVLPYRVPMPHAHHTFRPGHRVMVQIQSTWFPLYDRNPQTFVENIAWAKPEDYRRATHRIHHDAAAASYVEVRVMD